MVRHHAKTLIYRHFAPYQNPYQTLTNLTKIINARCMRVIFMLIALILVACDAFYPLVGNFPTYRESRFKRSPTHRGI